MKRIGRWQLEIMAQEGHGDDSPIKRLTFEVKGDMNSKQLLQTVKAINLGEAGTLEIISQRVKQIGDTST